MNIFRNLFQGRQQKLLSLEEVVSMVIENGPRYKGKQFQIDISTFDVNVLKKLTDLEFEVSIILNTEGRLTFFVGEENEENQKNFGEPLMMLHTHPRSGSKHPSFQDVSADEFWRGSSSSLKSYLLTSYSLIEYSSNPEVESMRGVDIRDLYFRWEKDHSLDSLNQEAYNSKLFELMQSQGFFVREVKLNELELEHFEPIYTELLRNESNETIPSI